MKQLTPYIFPAVAIVIVIILIFRWYRLNTQTPGAIPDYGEQVQVEDLTPEEENSILRGTDDYSSVELTPADDMAASGTIRYESDGTRVRFSVMANLPELETGKYQVWLRDPSQQSIKPVFELEVAKGGYMGSASFLHSALPVEVVVSQEQETGDQPTSVMLEGLIPLEELSE